MKYQQNILLTACLSGVFACLCLVGVFYIYTNTQIALWPKLLFTIFLSASSILTLFYCWKSKWGRATRNLEWDSEAVRQIDDLDCLSFTLKYSDIEFAELVKWMEGSPDLYLIHRDKRFKVIDMPKKYRLEFLSNLNNRGIAINEK